MILITGGAGYIGSHCAIKFMQEGAEVVLVDNFSTSDPQTVEALKNIGKFKFEECNLTDENDTKDLISSYDIECVIHCADVNMTYESLAQPAIYYQNNILSTLNLLNCMIENKINYLIFSSTTEVYGKPIYYPIDEIHPQLPETPYGRTKVFCEKILEDYDHAYGIKSVKLRYNHAVSGYNQELLEKELIQSEVYKGNFLKSALYNYCDPELSEYIDINDVTNAYFMAYKSLTANKLSNVFNLAPELRKSKNDLLEKLQFFFSKANLKTNKSSANLLSKSKINIRKAKQLLGWQPIVDMDESINNTIQQEKMFEKVFMENSILSN